MEAGSDVDPGDLHPQIALAVTDLAVVALAALVLLDVDLVALLFADDVGGDGRLRNSRKPDLGRAFAGHEQHAVELNGLFVLLGLAIDEDRVAAGHFELLAALFDD